MAIPITIPRLGWSMEEGTFGEWLLKDGDTVTAGAAIFLMESEKALQEVESVDEGTLHILPEGPQPGDTVTVGTLIGYLLDAGEEPPAHDSSPAETHHTPVAATPDTTAVAVSGIPPAAVAQSSQAAAAPPSVRRMARQLGVSLDGFRDGGRISERDVLREAERARGVHAAPQDIPRRNSHRGLPTISPRAARIAAERGIDWTKLRGSGRSGRIRECDIPAGQPNRVSTETTAKPAHGRITPLSSTRRRIADRLSHHAVSTVPVTLTTSVDVSNIVRHRQDMKQRKEECPIPAYHDWFVLAVAKALGQFPEMQRQWTDAGLLDPFETNIGLAVDTEHGLLVPVIRNAHALTLADIAGMSADLIRRTRDRTIPAEELSGGTFTITNLGAFGIDSFTPVINPPESAILGMGAIRNRQHVDDKSQAVVQQQMTLSLTFDHRITDGANAARFLQTVANTLGSGDWTESA